jgi:FtsP/CotA-like multicopper oxidase with cupredoxin domain
VTAENAATNPATGKPFGGPVTLENGLINGKNTWGSVTNTTVNGTTTTTSVNNGTVVGSRYIVSKNIVANKKYRLRIINSSIQSTYKVYLDGHKFQVIAMDLVPIVPYTTTILNINIGQRYDIIITADQAPGNYWLRADNQNSCAATIQAKDIKAIFSYAGFSGTPTTTAYNYTDACIDEPASSLVPYVPVNVGPADITEPTLNVLLAANNASLYKWSLNSYTFLQQWDQPTLLSIDQTGSPNNSSGPLLFQLPQVNQWVYIIIQSPIPLPHPIHLHGHDFHILASGAGTYASGTTLQTTNPPRRDTVLMPAAGYVVIGFITDNPGTWLAHCHIGWHVSMGFAIQFVERKDEIKTSGGLSNSCGLEDNCSKWKTFAAANNIVQHDSGV